MVPAKQENQKVVFRRIRGRVVPIRQKTSGDLKGAAIGVGAAGLGLATTVAGGNYYKSTLINSIKNAFKALDSSVGVKDGSKEFEYLAKAKKFRAVGNVVAKAAPLIGAGLMGFGVYKTIDSIPRNKRKKIDPALTAGGVSVATASLPKIYNFSKNAFNAGFKGRQGVFQFAKSSASSATPYARTVLNKFFKGL